MTERAYPNPLTKTTAGDAPAPESKLGPPQPEFHSISHALLDKALEILSKNPATWTHADDLFMLSIYSGRDKAELVGFVQKIQAVENIYGRLSDGEIHPALPMLRPRLAAGVDWRLLLGPVKKQFSEFFVGWKKFGARRTESIEYHERERLEPAPEKKN